MAPANKPGSEKSKPGSEKSKSKQPEKKRETRVYSVPAINEFTNKYWDCIVLPILGVGLLTIGVTLITIGAIRDIDDLIILGCLLGIGCLVFFFLLYTAVCRPRCQRNMINSFDMDKQNGRPTTRESQMSNLTDYGYYNVAYNSKDDVLKKDKVLPSETQLYGDKMRSFMATPVTTKDVSFYDGADTPPPPRVALPCAPGGKSKVSFTMELDEVPPPARYPNDGGISSLELL